MKTIVPLIQEDLTRVGGPDAVSKLENNNANQIIHFRGDEGNNWER